MEQNKLELKRLFKVLKRRKWEMALPIGGIMLVTVILVLSWSPIYQSTSTILIEEQEIPKEYVATTVTGYAEQHLHTISQRIMSYSQLLKIIQRFNLYADIRSKSNVEAVIDRMRRDIKFRTISAEVLNKNTGMKTAATIAFTVSYEGEKPAVVQKVANVLSSLYLEENMKSREQKTTGASKFIENERNQVKADLAQLDAKIASFQQSNLDSLPELSPLNQQVLDRNDQQIVQLNDQRRTLHERKSNLQRQLANLPANLDEERLKELRAKIADLRTTYTEKHPDVIVAKQSIAELEQRLDNSRQDDFGRRADNPMYTALSIELTDIESEIKSISRQIRLANRKHDSYRSRIESGPLTEEQYRQLLRERNNLQAKYDDLTKKYMEAEVAHGMEKGQMGERFTLLDSARLPERPIRPNIPLVLLVGLIIGTGAGIGTVGIREHFDQAAHSVEDIEMATGTKVLAAIPEIMTRQDQDEEKKSLRTLMMIARNVRGRVRNAVSPG